MSGFILKDVFNIMSQGKQILLMLLFFGVCFSGSAASGIIVAICTVACAALLISSFSMDEMCQWNKQAFIMPLSRKKVVLSKYLVAVLCTLFGIGVGVLLSLIAVWIRGDVLEVSVLAGAAVAGIEVSLLYGAVLLPVVMKFGVTKGRFVIFGLIAIPFLAGTFLTDRMSASWLRSLDVETVLAGGMAGVFLLLIVSYLISVRIVEKQEF